MTGRLHSRNALWAGAVVLGALVVGAVVLLLARSWSAGEGGSYAPVETVVATRLEPPSILFGDPVDAIARIVVDERSVDPASVSLDPSFKPFQAFVTTRRVLEGTGHAAEVRFRFRLQCVTGACIRAMERELRGGSTRTVPIELPEAIARGRTRERSAVAIPVTWPTVVIHSRLTAEDIANADPVAPRFVAPAPGYAVDPDVLAWLLVAVAVAAILTAGALIAAVVASRRRVRRLQLPAHLGPVDRSLALARHALETGDVDGGRRALERLSGELEENGLNDLADQAARLAWSPPGPSEPELDDLSRLVRSGADGR